MPSLSNDQLKGTRLLALLREPTTDRYGLVGYHDQADEPYMQRFRPKRFIGLRSFRRSLVLCVLAQELQAVVCAGPTVNKDLLLADEESFSFYWPIQQLLFLIQSARPS